MPEKQFHDAGITWRLPYKAPDDCPQMGSITRPNRFPGDFHFGVEYISLHAETAEMHDIKQVFLPSKCP